MLDIEIPLMKYKSKTVKCYKEYFYKIDYHGDYSKSFRKIYDIDESKINDIIQDMHTLQYGNETYTNKYKFLLEVEIPFNVSNVYYFMTFYYNDYKKLIEKIRKNTFRSIKSRNNAVILLNKMIEGDVNMMKNIPIYKFYNH